MPFQFFTVPIQDDGTAAAELNGFQRSHRVLSVTAVGSSRAHLVVLVLRHRLPDAPEMPQAVMDGVVPVDVPMLRRAFFSGLRISVRGSIDHVRHRTSAFGTVRAE